VLTARRALGQLRDWFDMRAGPDVVIAQHAELKRQVPLLYALLLLNAAAVTYTHWHLAPKWLTMGFNGLLVTVCLYRATRWWRAEDAAPADADRARHELRRTTLFAGLIGFAFVSWSLLLNRYGGAIERGHVAFFIGITVIGCTFCLVNLPQAALVLTVAVTLPYLGYYLVLGDHVLIATALNIALVTAVMMRVLLTSFTRFEGLINSRAILAEKQREAELLGAENAQLAHTDVLTGLPNRRHFFGELDRGIHDAREAGRRIAVGVVDLDRFKPVNDTYGHVIGDRLLFEVGRRIGAFANDDVVLARLGGDEFGMLLTRDIDVACDIGQAICDALALPFHIEGHRIVIGASAGVAVFPDAGITVHELFDRSDYALYHVKSRQRGRCALFSLEHETMIRSERAVEAALQAADLDAELHVQYELILSTATREVIAVEALGRWTSPVVGVVGPDRFITTAERLGFIHAITLTLFGKALADFAQMPATIGLSFNLSAHDITSPETIARLIGQIAETGIDPERITFELTETAVMRDFDAAVEGIRALRALGTRIALDDFGMGYSSLGYLQRLPLDKVKVDRSFIADMDEAAARNILTAILGLCRTLGLDCIIEGVETETQLRSLADFGYKMAQGHLFARPMKLGGLLAWLRRQREERDAVGQGAGSRCVEPARVMPPTGST
jgi:diguanylate cyclase (GGDEF)-like protein